MPWKRLEEILTSSALDRETKLAAIDLIAMSPDESLVEEVIQLLNDWKESDDQAQDVFKTGLEKIVAKYQEKEKRAEEKGGNDTLEIVDDIESQAKIKAIKEKISNLNI